MGNYAKCRFARQTCAQQVTSGKWVETSCAVLISKHQPKKKHISFVTMLIICTMANLANFPYLGQL
jgi:hypothetical protein